VQGRRPDEGGLVERARHGDVAAFESLVRAHQDLAFRTAWVCSGGADDAEDAAQEGFMKAYRALPGFRVGAPFRPWLLTIVANEARNRRRSAGRRAALVLTAGDRLKPGESDASPEDSAITRERHEALMAGLARLGDADREVLTLRYLLELSEAETAAALDVPIGTVKSRASRALGRLRERLTEMEVAS